MFVDCLHLPQMNHFWKCAKCKYFSEFGMYHNNHLKPLLRYGSIASSKAIIDQKSGECKGYGFAMFNNEQECEEAIEGLNKAGIQASFARVGQVKSSI